MVAKKKKTHYSGVSLEEMRLTSCANIKVNGVEVAVSDYLKNPTKYNSIQMDEQYVEDCKAHLEESKKAKERLQVDPSSIKSFI